MVAVSDFKMTGSRNRLELHFNKALKELNKYDDLWLDQYIARKLSAWYTKFPPIQRGGARLSAVY